MTLKALIADPSRAGHGTDGRRLGSIAADDRADGRLPQLFPVPAREDLREEVVHELLRAAFVLRQADTVGLLRERLTDHLDLVVRAGVADQDALVQDVGVDASLLDGGDALRVGLEQRHLRIGHGLLQRQGCGRVALRRDVLAVQVVDALDRVVVRGDHDRVTGLVVGPGEVDLLRPLRRDRVGGDHRVDRAVLEQRLPGVHRGDGQLFQVGDVGLAGDVVRQHLRQPGVENSGPASVPPRCRYPRSLMACAQGLAEIASSSATGPEVTILSYALASVPPLAPGGCGLPDEPPHPVRASETSTAAAPVVPLRRSRVEVMSGPSGWATDGADVIVSARGSWTGSPGPARNWHG